MSACTLNNGFLCKHSLFGGLSDADLDEVRLLLDETTYPKGTVVLRQGESNSTVYFIVKGDISIRKHVGEDAGSAREITVLHEGDSFGEMELIDIQPCAASAVCLTEVNAITLSNRALYRLSCSNLKAYTLIIMNLARDISRRLRSTDNLLALVSSKQQETGAAR